MTRRAEQRASWRRRGDSIRQHRWQRAWTGTGSISTTAGGSAGAIGSATIGSGCPSRRATTRNARRIQEDGTMSSIAAMCY
jgi:hypothetical protein